MMFFFCFYSEISFSGANLVQKIKIICWSWNLAPRLIRIWEFDVDFPVFSFLDQKYPFWGNLVQKFKIFCLCWNLILRLFRICKIRCDGHLSVLDLFRGFCQKNSYAVLILAGDLKPVTFLVLFSNILPMFEEPILQNICIFLINPYRKFYLDFMYHVPLYAIQIQHHFKFFWSLFQKIDCPVKL